MKRYIRVLCLMLAAILILAVPAQAAEVTPRSSAYFSTYDTYLYQTSDTEFQIWFDVLATGMMDKIGVSLIKIQRSTDGENWETIETAYAEDYSTMMNENDFFCANYISYTGEPGYAYRARVKFYAEKGSGIGGLYDYTNNVVWL